MIQFFRTEKLKQKETKMKRGFTLVELLVVVLIIGILSSVALPKYQAAVDKARYTELFILGKAIAQAEELYYLENGKYTQDLEELSVELSGYTKNEETGHWVKDKKYVAIGNYSEAVILSDGSTSASLVLFFQKALYNPGERQCRSPESEERGKRICKSLGGVYKTENENNGTIYILP